MPTPASQPAAQPARHPLTAYTALRYLDDARATVLDDLVTPGQVIAQVGATFAAVQLIGDPANVRRLVTDLLAQLDAMGTGL